MRCRTRFAPSQTEITTDVAAGNGGLGDYPAPGELLAATLASCMLSMIAFTGKHHGFETRGIKIHASCAEGSRGVGAFRLHIEVPFPAPEFARRLMEKAVISCPVAASLHPDIPKHITWEWA